jgi:hypothetical protein
MIDFEGQLQEEEDRWVEAVRPVRVISGWRL